MNTNEERNAPCDGECHHDFCEGKQPLSLTEEVFANQERHNRSFNEILALLDTMNWRELAKRFNEHDMQWHEKEWEQFIQLVKDRHTNALLDEICERVEKMSDLMYGDWENKRHPFIDKFAVVEIIKSFRK